MTATMRKTGTWTSVLGVGLALALAGQTDAQTQDLLVSDPGVGEVGQYDAASGLYVGSFIAGVDARDMEWSDGMLYAADSSNSITVACDDTGANCISIVVGGAPLALTLDPTGTTLYVSYDQTNQVDVYDVTVPTTPAYVDSYFTSGTNIEGLAYGADGNVYAYDDGGQLHQLIPNTNTATCVGFGPASNFVSSYGTGLTVGPNGKLWASGGDCIVSFDDYTGFNPTTFANTPNSDGGDLAWGDDGNLYLADGAGGQIVSYTPAGMQTGFQALVTGYYIDFVDVLPEECVEIAEVIALVEGTNFSPAALQNVAVAKLEKAQSDLDAGKQSKAIDRLNRSAVQIANWEASGHLSSADATTIIDCINEVISNLP
ncbi:hypothetical protein OAX78_00890 [Planctomycetota bacterium]|nr:hypothetical protein [Planctomycetota bacterium]